MSHAAWYIDGLNEETGIPYDFDIQWRPEGQTQWEFVTYPFTDNQYRCTSMDVTNPDRVCWYEFVPSYVNGGHMRIRALYDATDGVSSWSMPDETEDVLPEMSFGVAVAIGIVCIAAIVKFQKTLIDRGY